MGMEGIAHDRLAHRQSNPLLLYIAGFVICTTNTTDTAMMMMIQHLILMRDIPLDMILIKVS